MNLICKYVERCILRCPFCHRNLSLRCTVATNVDRRRQIDVGDFIENLLEPS